MPGEPAPEFLLTSLRYVLGMRVAIMVVQGTALIAAWRLFHLQTAYLELCMVLGVMLVVTWRSFRSLGTGVAPDAAEFFRQLVFDVAALSAFLYFTGGATNPLAPLILLPVVVAVATLPAVHAWWIAVIATGFYSLLMFSHVPLHLHGDASSSFDLHVRGMWLGFLLAAVLVTYFVSRIGLALRARDAEIARSREQALETGKILALGTLAAGTAHELGTPLSTMAVVVGELREARKQDPELLRELDLLRDQIVRCKEILRRMSSSAGQVQAERGGAEGASDYMRALVREWQQASPGREVSLQLPQEGRGPRLVVDHTVTQAIVNALDNAAQVSTVPPVLTARWDDAWLEISIRDFGPGVPVEVASAPGPIPRQADDRGLGLGVFLARTTILRLGGTLEFREVTGEQGCLTVLRLPLANLRLEAPEP